MPSYNGVNVLLGNGDGTFEEPKNYPTTYPCASASVADVNGDGRLDIITDGMDVLLGNGDGTFTEGQGYFRNQQARPSYPIRLSGISMATANSMSQSVFGCFSETETALSRIRSSLPMTAPRP